MRLSSKSLVPVIYQAKDVIYARSIVTNLLSKCEKISQKMEKQVADLIGSNNESESESGSGQFGTLEIKSQPKILNKK